MSWERDDIASVNIANPDRYYVVNKEGVVVPSQVINEKDKKTLQFVAKNIPSLGYSTFYLVKGRNNIKSQQKNNT